MHWQGEKQRAEGGGRASPVVAVMKLEAGSQLNVYLENSNFLCFFILLRSVCTRCPPPPQIMHLGLCIFYLPTGPRKDLLKLTT